MCPSGVACYTRIHLPTFFSMNTRALTAEFIGTFALALGVTLSVARDFPFTPLVAAMTVGLFVYTVGSISGSHLNPAVTFGLWSIKKIKPTVALQYLGVQLLAGVAALLMTWFLTGDKPEVNMDMTWSAGLGEILGGFLLVFGVSSVVWGKVKDEQSGLVIGGSLLIGILIASALSMGIVNPAVSVALGVLSPMYLIGTIVGGILAAQTYQWLVNK